MALVLFLVDASLLFLSRNCGTEIHPSEVRSLQLQFLNSLSLPVFTGTRIEGEECSNLKIALVDALNGQIIDSGPESSAKVEIVVLEGDFDGDEGDDWTHEEFKNNIVREREGKKPLLTGDVSLNLKEGTGLVGEISFTDNSSWTRSRKFRLGARVVDNADGTRTREAKTESFIVRDHRGECEYRCLFCSILFLGYIKNFKIILSTTAGDYLLLIKIFYKAFAFLLVEM